MKALIICGGSGTRLYPVSTDFSPKQFCRLFGDKTLFQRTIERLIFLGVTHIFPVHQEKYSNLVKSQISPYLDECVQFNSIIEPIAKNTGPAIALGLIESLKISMSYQNFCESSICDDINEDFLIVPSDHILDSSPFKEVVEKGIKLINSNPNTIVIFGKKPTYPEIGFGYVSISSQDEENGGKIISFLEKPGLTLAKKFIEKGFLWNMGCFLAKRSTLLSEIEKYNPGVIERVTLFLDEKKESYFSSIESLPFDKMVMEKTDDGWCLPYQGDWNDVGNWKEAFTFLGGNILNNDDDEINVLTKLPIKVVKNNGITTIFDDDTYHLVKELVTTKKKDRVMEITPWGMWRKLTHTSHTVTKEVTISPGCRTSLQLHSLRNERLTILSGEGELKIGNDCFILSPEVSILIPGGSLHRISNTGNSDLKFIEIQSGIIDEEDITRLEDDYGRSKN